MANARQRQIDVRAVDGRPDLDEDIPHPELAALVAALTPEAYQALATADGVRQVLGRLEVSTEHLLAGLWAALLPMRLAATASARTVESLLPRLADGGFDAPDVGLLERIALQTHDRPSGDRRTPRMSPDVRAALQRAAESSGPDGRISVERLHAAALATPSPVTSHLAEIGIVDDLARGVAEPSATHASTEAADQPADQPTDAAPRIGAGRGAANDQAEGEDRLNFGHYVHAFADLVDSPDTRPPLTVGVFGAWGAGKSFLLRRLTDEIARRGAELRPSALQTLRDRLARRRRARDARPPQPERAFVYCVSFNAWEYNAAEHIWPRLVRRVLDGVTREASWRRQPARWAATQWRKLRRNFWRKLRADWKTLAAWLVVGATVWWAFAHLQPRQAQALALRLFRIDTSDDKFSAPAIVGAAAAAAKLLVSTFITPLGGWVTALLDDGPGYGGESDFVRAVRADLDLVDRQLAAEGSRVLITIDDLDRCEPDKAVEVLQAINQLLDRRSFVVFLGIDARVITAAVEKHYEDLLGPAGITGYEYLDKIVQIPFRIPEPSGDVLAAFLSKQLGDPVPGDPALPHVLTPEQAEGGPHIYASGIHLTPSSSDSGTNVATVSAPAPETGGRSFAAGRLSFTHDELEAFRAVTPFLRPNPRHVKRLVNVYALVRSLAALGGSRAILDDPAATVRWLTLCAQWPYAVYVMLGHLDAHGQPTPPSMSGGAPPLRVLYDAVQASLDPAKQARFDHDPAALRRLVASSQELSWEEIRALRGYTVNFNPALEAELRADVAERGRRTRSSGAAYDRRATRGTPATPPAQPETA